MLQKGILVNLTARLLKGRGVGFMLLKRRGIDLTAILLVGIGVNLASMLLNGKK
jgi:hypothetical protein